MMKNRFVRYIGSSALVLCALAFPLPEKAAFAQAPPLPAQPAVVRPKLTGKLVFQRSTPGQQDAELLMFDFETTELTSLSKGWPVTNATNPHFAPNGQALVFNAVSQAEQNDIFHWKIGDPAPFNLTENNDSNTAEARFSLDGKSILFKQDTQIAVLPERGGVFTISIEPNGVERFGPVVSPDGSRILFAEGTGADSDIYACNIDGSNNNPVIATQDLREHSPIPWTQDRIIYSRWNNDQQRKDYLYEFNMATQQNKILPFNQPRSDSTNPCPIDDQWVVFSNNSTGGHRLYVGNAETQEVWPLAEFNPAIDGEGKQELGATYHSGVAVAPETAPEPDAAPEPDTTPAEQ